MPLRFLWYFKALIPLAPLISLGLGAASVLATSSGALAQICRSLSVRRSARVREQDRVFQPVMTTLDRLTFVTFLVPWGISLWALWAWWMRAEHVTTLHGMVVTSLLLAWSVMLPGWFFFFAGRMRRPDPEGSIPPGKVAMIVTKAPSEPWPIVRRTLEGMLNQKFPHPFDVWLADEDPDAEVRDWCAQQGVQISCRKGVDGYHNTTWPGREKCKEGNLRYFYEVANGYERYQFVAQLDADHVPTPGYLAAMIRPFADSGVGYVAAPSICDANAASSWTARGRLDAEATLHGVLQAGYSNGFSPLCIGSHYAVRTRALREIGGLGPELAEDHTTTLMMNAHGWRGSFAFDAIAHGDGPASFADCMTQEFQWSRSLTRVLLGITQRYWAPLPMRLKVQFGFAQLWYPLFALHLLVASFVPVVALVTRVPWMNVHLHEFLVFSLLNSVTCIVPVLWLRSQRWLRPTNAAAFSWEMVLFQLARWPYIVLGVVNAVIGVLLRREFQFKITPKGVNGPPPFALRLVIPYIVIVVLSAGAAMVVGDAGNAAGYYSLALFNALTYSLVIIAVIGLHCKENNRFVLFRHRERFSGIPGSALATVATCAMVVMAIQVRGGAMLGSVAIDPWLYPTTAHASNLQGESTPDVVASPVVAVPIDTVTGLAANVPPAIVAAARMPEPAERLVLPFDLPANRVSIGAYDPTQSLRELDLDIDHWYVPQDRPDMLQAQLNRSRNRRTALVTIEPFPTRRAPQPVLDRIDSGERDEEIRRLAQVIRRSSPQVVAVRWGHEMELSGLYPWAANHPELYRSAYRRVVSIFRAEGAANVRWVWSPAGNANLAEYYPGDDVVDFVGLTVLGDEEWDWSWGLPPQSFTDVITERYRRVAQFGRPIIVAELGVSGDPERQRTWLRETVPALREFPMVQALVYFNAENPVSAKQHTRPDWQLAPNMLAPFAKSSCVCE